MGSLIKEDECCYTKSSEIILLKLTFTMVRRVFSGYVVPFLKRVYPVIASTISKSLTSLSSAKFLKNKTHVSALVKNVYGKVKIYVINDPVLCNEFISKRILNSGVKFIGLDCEWESDKQNGVSLIQISCGNDCILYRCFKSDVVPETLRQMLEDHTILKFGVAIDEDARRLVSYGINVRGFVDLRHLADRCLPHLYGGNGNEEQVMIRGTGLKALSFNVLDITLSKNRHIQCSKWETDILSTEQVLYAAKDAIVSLEIFYALALLRKVSRQGISVLSDAFVKEMNEPDHECLTEHKQWGVLVRHFLYCHERDQLIDVDITSQGGESNKPSTWLVDLACSLCQGIVESKYKNKSTNPKRNKTHSLKTSSRNISTNVTKLKEYKHQCRDRPLYENCFLKGPDGTVLATVNRSKASWYVNKNLGEVIDEDPFTVRLFFEPSGRPMPDADYYTTIKDNVCVVCEGTDRFVRKMIIPHDYRRYFPLELKDHMSHDVLLMCLNCHRIAQRWDEQLKQELADKYNAPLGTKGQRMYFDNPQLSKVKSAAKALHLNGKKIPESRAKVLKAILEKYSGKEVTDDVIKEIAVMDIKIKNVTFGEPHGQRVVNAFVSENKLPEFIRMWRQHFLTNMQPKHLPPMWSVEHNLDKLRAIKVTSV